LRGCGHPDYFDDLAKCVDAAAAFSTVATMGREQFTIKTLREAFDLPYHQTCRHPWIQQQRGDLLRSAGEVSGRERGQDDGDQGQLRGSGEAARAAFPL